MSEGKSETISRRGAIKALLGLAAAGAMVKVGADTLGASGDIYREENLKEFLQGQEIFPGYHAYYQGRVTIPKNVQTYNRATYEMPQRTSEVITVPTSGNTKAGRTTQETTVKEPFIFLKEAGIGSSSSQIVELKSPRGEVKMVDLGSSWLLFPDQSKNQSQFGIVTVPIGELNLSFETVNGKKTFLPEAESIVFDSKLSFGEIQ